MFVINLNNRCCVSRKRNISPESPDNRQFLPIAFLTPKNNQQQTTTGTEIDPQCQFHSFSTFSYLFPIFSLRVNFLKSPSFRWPKAMKFGIWCNVELSGDLTLTVCTAVSKFSNQIFEVSGRLAMHVIMSLSAQLFIHSGQQTSLTSLK